MGTWISPSVKHTGLNNTSVTSETFLFVHFFVVFSPRFIFFYLPTDIEQKICLWRGYEGLFKRDTDVFQRRVAGKGLERNTIRRLILLVTERSGRLFLSV
jgi:hypothetical protein